MPAANYDFVIEQGTTFVKTLSWLDKNKTPINLTGYTAKMQIRPSESSSTVLLELSTTNGLLSITPLTGTIYILLDKITTAGFKWRLGVYDLLLTSIDGNAKKLIKGEINVAPGVTR